jgi:hypothetical protein
MVSRFGEIKRSLEAADSEAGETRSAFDDYDGWEIELNGLPIEIVTFDYEEPETETAFSIYSHHIASLELLAQEFGVNTICDTRPVQINQLAA